MTSLRTLPLALTLVLAAGSVYFLQARKRKKGSSERDDELTRSCNTVSSELCFEESLSKELAQVNAKVESLPSEIQTIQGKLLMELSAQNEKDEEVRKLKEEIRVLRTLIHILNLHAKEIATKRTQRAGGKQASSAPSGMVCDHDNDAAPSFSNETTGPKLIVLGNNGTISAIDEVLGMEEAELTTLRELASRYNADEIISLVNRASEKTTTFPANPVLSKHDDEDTFPHMTVSFLAETMQDTKDIDSSPMLRESMLPKHMTSAAMASSVSSESTAVTTQSTQGTTVEYDREDLVEGENMKRTLSSVTNSSDNGTCTCSSSLFSGDEAQIDLFLPNVSMACKCGKRIQEIDPSPLEERGSLKNILRPWQVQFLESLGIKTAEQLIISEKKDPKNIARQMKSWREEHHLVKARTKKCHMALHIWARSAKVALGSACIEAGEQSRNAPAYPTGAE
eukprot:CAMPEP_0197432108 /NCGR_PEP_ID=MMETSP1175-20131217/208_1 /TAXON_ID=1003142 /ORGANISM="Triceratium dubium, Strain CCMP147" /LENGTH=452 /DNA_ID=CAMNT_0042960099 /DNA_START=183 /DNA_END=1541 /DNA_ORIENTATION=-